VKGTTKPSTATEKAARLQRAAFSARHGGRSTDMMKYIYMIVLVAGLLDAVVMQFVTIALPRDALVASVLAKNQDKWSITIDTPLPTPLDPNEIKPQLVTALQNRRIAVNAAYGESLRRGVILIALAVLGLSREAFLKRKVRESNKASEAIRR